MLRPLFSPSTHELLPKPHPSLTPPLLRPHLFLLLKGRLAQNYQRRPERGQRRL